MQSQSETQSLSPADLQLIELYFNPQFTTHDIASKLDMPVLQVLAALERPDIAACIERLAALSVRRARDISLAFLPDNIERLQRIGETSKNEEIARKSLSAVMRFALRRETPGRAAKPRPPRQGDQAADLGDNPLPDDAANASSRQAEQDPQTTHARREPSPATISNNSHHPSSALKPLPHHRSGSSAPAADPPPRARAS